MTWEEEVVSVRFKLGDVRSEIEVRPQNGFP